MEKAEAEEKKKKEIEKEGERRGEKMGQISIITYRRKRKLEKRGNINRPNKRERKSRKKGESGRVEGKTKRKMMTVKAEEGNKE